MGSVHSTHNPTQQKALRNPVRKNEETPSVKVVKIYSQMDYLVKGKNDFMSSVRSVIIESNFLNYCILNDQVSQNATWDIYTDDCYKLIRHPKDTVAPIPIAYTEHQSYYNGKLTNDKVINDLCWHPFWTGIAVAAYTEYCKSDCLVGPSSKDVVIDFFFFNLRTLV